MLKLQRTPEAESDLIDIWRFTFEAWGEQQAEKYLDALEAGMAQLTRMPNIGKARDAVRPGYRSLQVGRHVIFYRTLKGAIDIVRVLHDRMDPDVQLGL